MAKFYKTHVYSRVDYNKIHKGDIGYFSNSYSDLIDIVENDYSLAYGPIKVKSFEEQTVGLGHHRPFVDEYGLVYAFFYLVKRKEEED